MIIIIVPDLSAIVGYVLGRIIAECELELYYSCQCNYCQGRPTKVMHCHYTKEN